MLVSPTKSVNVGGSLEGCAESIVASDEIDEANARRKPPEYWHTHLTCEHVFANTKLGTIMRWARKCEADLGPQDPVGAGGGGGAIGIWAYSLWPFK